MMPLDEETGTNILGELIEASNWSANKLLYGDMHNFGHYALCYIHDPDRSYSVNDIVRPPGYSYKFHIVPFAL